MTQPVTVRPAQLGDLRVIVELRLALLREYGDHPLYGNLREDAEERAYELYQVQLVSPNEVIFVAERGNRIIGLLRCVDAGGSPLLYPERYCYVSSVYVRPAERRHGVLRELMRAAEQWCEARGLGEMRLHNVNSSDVAGSAWSSLGFDVVEHVRRRPLSSATRRTASNELRA
ncbi:MAG TPA: GNAT family N-acetyltransferase [Gemmatimonadaceae bacterium]